MKNCTDNCVVTENDHIEKKNEKGASLVEYALLVALIAIVALTALTQLGNQVSNTFSNIGSQLGGAN